MKCRKGILEPTRNKKEMICHTCGYIEVITTLEELGEKREIGFRIRRD
jgi:hypothetical protein